MHSTSLHVNYYSVTGGILSAFGSLLGKLTGIFGPDGPQTPFGVYTRTVREEWNISDIILEDGLADSWLWTTSCFLSMVAVNTAGFTLFAKALNASTTSLRPTLLSTASSYVTSALLGLAVFKEATSLLWWTGTALILVGILSISLDKQKVD